MAGFGQLKAVFPFDRVVVRAIAFVLGFDVDLGEPAAGNSVAKADGGSALTWMRVGGAGFEIDFALALFDQRRVDLVGRAGQSQQWAK